MWLSHGRRSLSLRLVCLVSMVHETRQDGGRRAGRPVSSEVFAP
jgi:hypothetical protein